MMEKNIRKYMKYLFESLCLKNIIPKVLPSSAPKKPSNNKVNSGILYWWISAFFLSSPYSKKAEIFITVKYIKNDFIIYLTKKVRIIRTFFKNYCVLFIPTAIISNSSGLLIFHSSPSLTNLTVTSVLPVPSLSISSALF